MKISKRNRKSKNRSKRKMGGSTSNSNVEHSSNNKVIIIDIK